MTEGRRVLRLQPGLFTMVVSNRLSKLVVVLEKLWSRNVSFYKVTLLLENHMQYMLAPIR